MTAACPGVIVRRTEEEFAEWLATEAGFLMGLTRYEDRPVQLERYQVAFLNNRSRFRWVTKSRQVGFSFVFALEALARCHLRDGHTAVFLSYNRDDAKEKILVAREVYETLPAGFRKRLIVDSKSELAFESNARGRRPSRIVSSPSKAPRGKKGDIYLDELAHYLNDRAVYKGSTALILRSRGQLTGCSTPLGKRGIFWEVAEEEVRPYPHHTRQVVPWWLCTFLCNDVPRAAREAPAMDTETRVRTFGTPDIVDQFESLPLEDFQQEFECLFVIEGAAYFPYELIIPCTDDDLEVVDDVDDMPRARGRLVAGYDVGRRHDRGELAIFDELESGRKICLLLRTFCDVPFDDQQAYLTHVLERAPIARLSVDEQGMGMQLAENLARDYPQVVPEAWTQASKERWVTDLKLQMQRRSILLPRWRDLTGEIHSVERTFSANGRPSFDVKRSALGHGDRFWAIALACQRDLGEADESGGTSGFHVFG